MAESVMDSDYEIVSTVREERLSLMCTERGRGELVNHCGQELQEVLAKLRKSEIQAQAARNTRRFLNRHFVNCRKPQKWDGFGCNIIVHRYRLYITYFNETQFLNIA